MSDKCSSVMSHTTQASKVSQRSAATSMTHSVVSSKVSAAPTKSVVAKSVARSAAGTTTTTVLQRQLESLESQLVTEKNERERAQAELKRTAAELEALEKLLKLKT